MVSWVLAPLASQWNTPEWQARISSEQAFVQVSTLCDLFAFCVTCWSREGGSQFQGILVAQTDEGILPACCVSSE
jgi:hypothetical protein